MHAARRWSVSFALTVLFVPSHAFALAPDNIALVVNKNAPNGAKLADIYAAARGVPAGRVITLDVPSGDELEFDQYERDVVPPIRQFLRDHHLERQVTCLVTFYGVPFRVRAKSDTDAEKKELSDLQDQLKKLEDETEPVVAEAEALTKQLDPPFQPVERVRDEERLEALARRASQAVGDAGGKLSSMSDLAARKQATGQVATLIQRLGGPAELFARFGEAQIQDPSKTPRQRQMWLELRDQVATAKTRVAALEERRFDADARAQVREVSLSIFGPINLAEVLKVQIDYLKPGVTNAALDSELALLWWGYYPRSGPQVNVLNFKAAPRRRVAPVLMVSRLDGPDEKTVEDLIHTSVRVEHDGLRGSVALNSFGYPNLHAPGQRNFYREFDRKIRDLGGVVHGKTGLELHEEYTRLFHRREVASTAVYCGWYSLRQYVPGMAFSPGAVGYHVASLEMVGLHGDSETGWVHGLMTDGVVATLGPVAEPYLWSFPPPDEFFPLLFTGKLTLAEVYWKTEPATSWMMSLVGDPLYTPYKANPPLKAADLPEALQPALAPMEFIPPAIAPPVAAPPPDAPPPHAPPATRPSDSSGGRG